MIDSPMHVNAQLFEALSQKNAAAAAAAINRGADVNGQTILGEGVWSFVIPAGIDSVRMALGFGANPNGLDAARHAALYWAVHAKNAEVAKVLIEAGASMEIDASDGFNVLHEAAMAGYADVVGALVGAAPDRAIHSLNVLGRTPLAEAIAAGNEGCARLIEDEIARRIAKSTPQGR